MKKYAIVLFILISASTTYGQTAMEVIVMMYKEVAKIEGFIAEIKKEERIEDEYVIQLSKVKLQREPYKVYVKQLAPKEGVEVLARAGNPKTVVNLNSFPWINLYLDPHGSLMRRNQHHVVYDSGFDLMISILKYELSSKLSEERLQRKENVIWQGKEMYHLELKNNDYDLIPYQVKPNETLDDIANKLHINAYAILELNKDVDDYEDVEEGQEIKVPTHYAKRMTLLIDKKTHLPLVIKVFDNKGLYEKYEYNSIRLNPVFAPNEFTMEYEGYNF